MKLLDHQGMQKNSVKGMPILTTVGELEEFANVLLDLREKRTYGEASEVQEYSMEVAAKLLKISISTLRTDWKRRGLEVRRRGPHGMLIFSGLSVISAMRKGPTA